MVKSVCLFVLMVCNMLELSMEADCSFGKYQCTGYTYCCKTYYTCSSDGLKCYYYTYTSGSSGGGSNVGPIIGYVIGGLTGVGAFISLCVCICAACKKNERSIEPRQPTRPQVVTVSSNVN